MRRLRFALRPLLITLAVIAVYFSAIGIQQYVFGNIHSVVEGEFYRSAQLSPEQITAVAKEKGIKSIINLRGDNSGTPWYDDEVKASKENNITHLNFRMKSSRDLTDAQVVELVALMKDAPKPVLVHCAAGADRSGLAAALYRLKIKGDPLSEASNELSLRYGHMPFYFNSSYAMERTLFRVGQRGYELPKPMPAPAR
jgi:protein tyrosine/serine phosphatase